MNSTVFKVLTKKDIFAYKRAKNGIVISDSEEHYFSLEKKILKIYMILIHLMETLAKKPSILKTIVETPQVVKCLLLIMAKSCCLRARILGVLWCLLETAAGEKIMTI